MKKIHIGLILVIIGSVIIVQPIFIMSTLYAVGINIMGNFIPALLTGFIILFIGLFILAQVFDKWIQDKKRKV